MFTWLRTRVKNAVLNGVADALDELARSDIQEDAQERLESRLRLLPGPVADEPDDAPTSRRRKATA